MKPNTKAWRKARRRRLRRVRLQMLASAEHGHTRFGRWREKEPPLVVHIICDARPMLDALANLSGRLTVLDMEQRRKRSLRGDWKIK